FPQLRWHRGLFALCNCDACIYRGLFLYYKIRREVYMMKQYLQKLMNGENITMVEMTEASRLLFDGKVTESEAGAFLGLLSLKGETADEITGLVQAIREKSPAIFTVEGSVIDNCGTGGDRSGSFNISTTSAFVIAGAGITVAKHGNRSVSSKTGSA